MSVVEEIAEMGEDGSEYSSSSMEASSSLIHEHQCTVNVELHFRRALQRILLELQTRLKDGGCFETEMLDGWKQGLIDIGAWTTSDVNGEVESIRAASSFFDVYVRQTLLAFATESGLDNVIVVDDDELMERCFLVYIQQAVRLDPFRNHDSYETATTPPVPPDMIRLLESASQTALTLCLDRIAGKYLSVISPRSSIDEDDVVDKVISIDLERKLTETEQPAPAVAPAPAVVAPAPAVVAPAPAAVVAPAPSSPSVAGPTQQQDTIQTSQAPQEVSLGTSRLHTSSGGDAPNATHLP